MILSHHWHPPPPEGRRPTLRHTRSRWPAASWRPPATTRVSCWPLAPASPWGANRRNLCSRILSLSNCREFLFSHRIFHFPQMSGYSGFGFLHDCIFLSNLTIVCGSIYDFSPKGDFCFSTKCLPVDFLPQFSRLFWRHPKSSHPPQTDAIL